MPDVRRLAGRLLGGDDEEGAHSTDTSSVAEAAQDPEISGPDERKDPYRQFSRRQHLSLS